MNGLKCLLLKTKQHASEKYILGALIKMLHRFCQRTDIYTLVLNRQRGD